METRSGTESTSATRATRAGRLLTAACFVV
jgi:hypothetical protein